MSTSQATNNKMAPSSWRQSRARAARARRRTYTATPVCTTQVCAISPRQQALRSSVAFSHCLIGWLLLTPSGLLRRILVCRCLRSPCGTWTVGNFSPLGQIFRSVWTRRSYVRSARGVKEFLFLLLLYSSSARQQKVSALSTPYWQRCWTVNSSSSSSSRSQCALPRIGDPPPCVRNNKKQLGCIEGGDASASEPAEIEVSKKCQ